MLKRGKKQLTTERNPRVSYQRQTAYHYSAKRSSADRLLDREQTEQIRDNKADRRHLTKSQRLVVAVMIVGAIYCMSLLPSAKVQLEGSTVRLRNQQAYQAFADEVIASSLLNHSKLTFNSTKVTEQLQSQLPEVSAVSVSTPIFLLQPQVRLYLSQPAALLVTESGTFLIDEQGRALANISKNRPSLDTSGLPLLQDQTGLEVQQGKPALTSGQVAYIHELKLQAEAKQIEMESMIMKSGGGELDVRYKGSTYTVKYNFFEDARLSFGTFFAAKEAYQKDKIKVSEYIDVRIPERAYVK
jgi:cell division septal protein FtsQ